jgi:hypothetical protein
VISYPARWTVEELTTDATTAAQQFRAERLAASDSWQTQYNQARKKFELLFNKLSDLAPTTITDASLTETYSLGLGEALRYLAGPPISDDDLQVIADVDSVAPGILKKNPEAVRKVFNVIERVIDPYRFPWMETKTPPTDQQREAALLASSVLLAAQRIATERRSDGKENQETRVKEYPPALPQQKCYRLG